MVTKPFNIFVGDCLFYLGLSFDLMNPSHRTLENMIFLFQPGEEAGDITPDVIYSGLAAVINLLISG